ncbi:MAG: Gfo/Idh/MocA family oxidoreductase [Victivallales bacterium]|nr:Gfo/Idh/MocA family oxidoreductase [Victivallales bacterium]
MMKKKIGFIDYFIDEWHANNYPAMIRNSSRKNEFEIHLAWEKITKPGARNLEKWCADFNIKAASGIEQVVEKCDCIAVLAPSAPQVHEELSDLALRSGKPVYIDKPFAPNLAAARRMIEKAAAHHTPMMSSSALRFGSELQKVVYETLAGEKAYFASTSGGGSSFWEYSIHQFEMLVMLLGTGASRVMQCGRGDSQLMLIDYPDKRRGVMNRMKCHSFQTAFEYGDGVCQAIKEMSDFFQCFIEAMLEFFVTGKPCIFPDEMLEVTALVETGIKALEFPDSWVNVER